MPFPLLPLAIGAGLGGLAGGLWGGLGSSSNSSSNNNNAVSNQPSGNFLTGYGDQTKQLPRYSPEQENLLKLLISRIQQSNPNFEGIANQARSDFGNKTIPSILQRFSAFGQNRDSSNLRGSLGSAASELETGLGALRSQYELANQGQLLQGALNPSYENIYIPETSGALGSLLSNPGFIQGAGSGLGSLIGGIGSGIGAGAAGGAAEGAASTLANSVGAGAAGSSLLPALGAGAGAGGLGLLLSYLINKNR